MMKDMITGMMCWLIFATGSAQELLKSVRPARKSPKPGKNITDPIVLVNHGQEEKQQRLLPPRSVREETKMRIDKILLWAFLGSIVFHAIVFCILGVTL